MPQEIEDGRCLTARAAGLRPQPPAGSSRSSIANARARRSRKELCALPKPRNTAELEVLSEWYFGKRLHIGTLHVYSSGGSYDVAEAYDSYHGEGWLFSKHSCEGYDYSRDFWRHVFGPLGTGGIARNSYGQFSLEGGHRELLRLQSLQDSWRRKDAGRVRNSLARLAPNSGGGKSAEIRGVRTLTSDRVDGADAVAQAMSASGQDPQGLEAKPASAVRKDAPHD